MATSDKYFAINWKTGYGDVAPQIQPLAWFTEDMGFEPRVIKSISQAHVNAKVFIHEQGSVVEITRIT